MNDFNSYNVEKGGTGIEKGGTGVEKGGTGVEQGGTGVEKGGTGIRRSRGLRLAALALAVGSMVGASAIAAPAGTWEDWGDMGGTVQFGVKGSTLTASWATFDQAGNPILLLGTGTLNKNDVVSMPLYKVDSGFQTNPAEPMPFLKSWGRVKLDFDGCGNAQGSVSLLKAEGAGTGDKAEGAGTGDKAEGAGTGKAEGAGTGKAEGAGTGEKAEGAGTGDKAEGAGTGDKAEGAGTGDKAEGAGTGEKYAFFGDVILVGPSGKAGCR